MSIYTFPFLFPLSNLSLSRVFLYFYSILAIFHTIHHSSTVHHLLLISQVTIPYYTRGPTFYSLSNQTKVLFVPQTTIMYRQLSAGSILAVSTLLAGLVSAQTAPTLPTCMLCFPSFSQHLNDSIYRNYNH